MSERTETVSPFRAVDGVEHQGSSSWQNLERGAGTIEVDYLNGEIVLLGREHGVPTPVNEALQTLAASAAREGRSPGSVGTDEVEREIARLGGESI